MFATAGVQLEEIRAQGFRYMNQYKAIMVDEVRSTPRPKNHGRHASHPFPSMLRPPRDLAPCPCAAPQVHERSPENDLLLACLRELMITNRKTRLVLMSATADFKRYLAYFREAVGEDDVATVAVDAAGPRRPLSLQVLTAAPETQQHIQHHVASATQRPVHWGIAH